MALDGLQLRQVMRRWCTGVTVLTTAEGGRRHGITVNSFTSLSLEPTLVLVCIDSKTRAHEAIPAAGHFAVNLLAAGQEDISQRFAGRRPDLVDPFADLAPQAAPSGAPVLQGVLGYLDCALHAALPGGDHTIYVGRVEHAWADDADRPPLVFFGGRYRTLGALPE